MDLWAVTGSHKSRQMKEALSTTKHLKDVAVTATANAIGLVLCEICYRVYCTYCSLPSKEAITDLPILYKRFFEIDLSYLKNIPWIKRCMSGDGLLPSLTEEGESFLEETVKSRLNLLLRVSFAVPTVQVIALLCGRRIPLKCILICWICFFYLVYRMFMKPCSLLPGMVRHESPSEPDSRPRKDNEADSIFTGAQQLFDEPPSEPDLQLREDDEADSIFNGIQQLFDESNYFGTQ